ncbi:MAG: hypothetical protein KA998_03285, partial [Rickettsiaceae bacterium]|nr:hypothetical protein [Rickettsiaceae bacterium]
MAPKSRVEFNERVDIARETPVENFHDFFSERLSHFNLDTKDLTPQKIIEEIGDASEDLKKEFSEFLETFFYDMDWTMAAVEKRSGKEDRGFLKLFKFIMEVINDPSLSKYRSGHDNVAPRSRDKINEERRFY